MEIKNLRRCGERILRAIKEKERIVLYGDTDLDGVCSVIVLKEAIEAAGGSVAAVYFPDREKEGHGLTESGLRHLAKFSPGLLVVMDLGITSFSETKFARSLGFEVIIIDHHEIIDKLPEAEIIVDPYQEGDECDFKDLATVGLAFKISQIILGERMKGSLKKKLLELVGLATIADMVSPIKENKEFIEEGKKAMRESQRPGIRAFLEAEEIKNLPNLEEKISKLISALNIREGKDHLTVSYLLLTLPSFEESRKIVKEVLAKHKERKKMIGEVIKAVEEKICEKEPIIFAGSRDFEFTLVSLAASRICQKHKKPTFIYKKWENEAAGSVRTPEEVDSISLMKKCSSFLLRFGGHSHAAGFRIKNENLEKFKECLIRSFSKRQD